MKASGDTRKIWDKKRGGRVRGVRTIRGFSIF